MQHEMLKNKALRGTLARVVVACVLGLVAVRSAPAEQWFVSGSGNDSNPGTKEQPFATFERAREAVRGASKEQPRRVIVCGGTYRVRNSLVLSAEDSGTEQYPVVWQTVPGEFVRLVGGTRLGDWQPVNDAAVLARLKPAAQQAVLVCDLKPLGIADLGTVQPQGGKRAELFFNRSYMTLARYPDEGWLRIADVPNDPQYKIVDPADPGYVRHRGPFYYDGDRPEQWRNVKDLWVHGYWTYDWADEYQQVERFELDKKLLWPKPPYHGYGYTKGQRYYFLNLLEELDQPGEWYLDRNSGLVYLWPPSPVDSAEVMFPDLDQPMLLLDGAQHISIQGMVFECSRAEAVVITGGTGNSVLGCVIRNVGRTAIDIRGGTRHTVQSCDIYDVGSTGIAVQGGDRATLARGDHTVENCDLHHYARVERTYRPAISLNGVGNRISHCYVHNAPHQGINYSGNDHVIEFSEITQIAEETGDVGAIYSAMDWSYMGHEFRHNYFHRIHGPGNLGCFTVYPDLPCGGIRLFGNVFYDVDLGFLTNSGRGMTIENNLFLRCPRTFHINVWPDTTMFRPGGAWRMVERLEEVKYDQPPYSTRYPVLARLAEDFAKGDAGVLERALPKDNIIRRNVSEGDQFLFLGSPASLDDVRVEKNLIANSVVFVGSPTRDVEAKTYSHDDPDIKAVLGKLGNIVDVRELGVIDPDGEDFRLRDDSHAQALEFEAIPFEQIGLQTDEYRRQLPLRSPLVSPASRSFVGTLEVRLVPCRRGAEGVIRYTLDGTDPTTTSAEYTGPLHLTGTTTLKAATFGREPAGSGRSDTVTAAFTATGAAE